MLRCIVKITDVNEYWVCRFYLTPFAGFCAAAIVNDVLFQQVAERAASRYEAANYTKWDFNDHSAFKKWLTNKLLGHYTSILFSGPDSCYSTKLFDYLLDNCECDVYSDAINGDVPARYKKVEYPEFLNINSFNRVKIRALIAEPTGSIDLCDYIDEEEEDNDY